MDKKVLKEQIGVIFDAECKMSELRDQMDELEKGFDVEHRKKSSAQNVIANSVVGFSFPLKTKINGEWYIVTREGVEVYFRKVDDYPILD